MKSILISISMTTLLCLGCASAPGGPSSSIGATNTDTRSVASRPLEAVAPSETPAEPKPRPITNVSELTLDRALEIALRNHPSLTALLRRVGMAEGDAVQAGLWPNPEIELGIEGYTPNGDDQPRDLARFDNAAILGNRLLAAAGSSLSIDVPSIPTPNNPNQQQNIIGISQTLPMWGTPGKARAAANIDTARWKAEHRVELLRIQALVKAAFQEVVYYQQVQVMMTELLETFDDILAVSRTRFEGGDIAKVDVIKAEANHERFVMDSRLAQQNLDNARAKLMEALGAPEIAIGVCVGDLESSLPELPDTVLSSLPPIHPQNTAWNLRQQRAEADIAVESSKKWSNPTLGIRYRDYEFTNQDTWDFFIGFELPIFNRNQGNLRRTRENLAREEALVAAERNAVDTQLRAALTAYSTYSERAEIFRENILPKMERALEIAQQTYEIGDIAILEVLDAYRSLSESRLSYLRDLFQAHLAAIQLERLSAAAPMVGMEAISETGTSN